MFAACTLFTAALLFAMWVKSIWDVDVLERPRHGIDLAVAPPPPPAPPPPRGGEKPHDMVIVPKQPTVRQLVQPVRIDKQPPHEEVTETPGTGDAISDVYDPNSTCDTCTGVTVGAPPVEPPKPPPLPAVPKIVPPAALEASRIAGEKQIEPDDVTKTEIQRSGKIRIVGTFKLCLDTQGSITSVSPMTRTGFDPYDTEIERVIRGTWRYRPFLVDGKPEPVCTAVTFIYSQR